MAGLTFAPFVTFLLCSWIFVLCQETQELKVKPGEDVTLQCQSHRDADIEVIKWSRTDLKPDDYIFFFRSDNLTNQHESYRGRVELRDPKMKDGDASMILKNLKTNDTGTYECRVAVKNSGRRKREAPKPICTIKLTVTEPGHTAGHKEGNVGLMVGLPVVAVLLVAVVGTMLFKKRRGETSHTGGETPHTGGKTPHTGGETSHTGGETDALNPPTSG